MFARLALLSLALSPIFYDPRCVNCHGAVNPFTVDGGHPEYINMVEVAKTFLNQTESRSKEIETTGPAATREARGIREIAESPVEVSDNDLIRMKALKPMENTCLADCHIDDWVPMPMSSWAVALPARDAGVRRRCPSAGLVE